MALGTGIGQARALLREGGEDWWMKRLAADMQAAKIEKAKQKAKQQEELATVLDFKIDYGKYLPAWGKEVAGVYANFINDYATMRQQDPNVSPLAVQVKAQEAKRRIAELEVQNDMAKKYLAEKDIKRNEQFDKALVSFDSNFETLNQLSNRGMYHVSPQGSFNYRQIPSKEIEIDWGTPMEESMPVLKGGYREIKMDFPAQYESFMIEQKKNDPIFRNQIMYELSEQNKDYVQKDDETDFQYSERMDDIVNMEIENRVRANRPPGFLKFETPATGGGGGAGAKKENYPVEKTKGYVPKTTDMPEGFRYDEYTKIVKSPFSISVSNANGEAWSADNGAYIPRKLNDKAVNFFIRPSSVHAIKVTDPKYPGDVSKAKYKLFVKGTLTRGQEENSELMKLAEAVGAKDGTPEYKKWYTTTTVYVPLESTGLKSFIEKNNDMSNMYEQMKSLGGQTKAPAKTSGGGIDYSKL